MDLLAAGHDSVRMRVQATVGLTDRIFTRLASQEATVVGQSQFMLDLSQIILMLRAATGRFAFATLFSPCSEILDQRDSDE